MASSAKPSATSTARRKSSKATMIITLKLSSKALRAFEPAPLPTPGKIKVKVKEESPLKDSPAATTITLPVATSSNEDNPSESNSNTPAPVGTPGPTSMPPPTEGVKKKGVKRSSAAMLGPDGLPVPKVRGKPGPKKKARLEDGSIDHSNTAPRAANGTAAHKLGPKANQGAINAGLRALDRSGKPCRKWARGGFKLKSFTGVAWEIPRWKAPPKLTVEGILEDSTSGDSSKENKDTSQMESEKSEKSNSGVDVEGSTASHNNASSPAASIPSAPTPPPAVVIPAEA